jgi:L-rhamnose mutarotase
MRGTLAGILLCAVVGCQTPPAAKPVYGPTNPSPEEIARMDVKRFAWVTGLDPAKEQYYRELHASVWPGVLKQIKASNIRNFSIYVGEIDGKRYLFSYLEYTGRDFEADMEAMAEDPTTQLWWKETDPCQIPLAGCAPGETWSDMEMLFLVE